MHVKNFLKPDRLHHRNPEVRQAAVESLDMNDPQSSVLLHEIATSDDETSVRAAAIDRLDSVSLLLALLDTDAVDTRPLRPRVNARVLALLEAGRVSDTDIELLLAQPGESWLTSVLTHCADSRQRQAALAQVTAEPALLEVIESSRFHDTRQQAAERLQSTAALKAAQQACRARDKLVARQLQERLDERAAADARRASDEQAVAGTLDGLRTLAGSVWSPQHSGRLQALGERWQALPAELREPHESEFAKYQHTVQTLIDTHSEAARTVADDPSPVPPAAALDGSAETASQSGDAGDPPAARTARDAGTPDAGGDHAGDAADKAGKAATAAPQPHGDAAAGESISDQPAAADRPAAPSSDLLALKQQLNGVALAELPKVLPDLRANAATEPVSDRDALLAHAEAVAVLFDPPFDVARSRPQAIHDRLRRVDTLLDLPALLPRIDVSDVSYLEELAQHRAALAAREVKAKQESADRVAATHRQFSILSASVADGKWAPASSMLRRLQKKMSAMEPAERAGLNDKLAAAEKQLEEMADWQDFASRPKLEALCEQMETLAAEPDPKPRARAQAVKELQNQWKAMGVSRAANDLWTRFKTAGDKAFEPCKAYFEAQQQEREAKLAAKAALCEKLESGWQDVDQEAPDYKAIQRLVNNARRDWSKNRVRDRKPDKALEERFSRALQPFDTLLEREYAANAALRQELVDKAARLAEGEINQHTANQARSLQSAWKQVGIMRRREDQALWEAFNGHCRTIFKHQHDAEREKYRASMGHVFRARDIIKELNRLAREGQADAARVQELSDEFQALEAFPDKERKFLQRDFRAARDACSRIRDTQSKRRRQAERDEVQRLLTLCEQLEAAVEQPEQMSDSLREDIEQAWEASDIQPPRDEMQALEERRDTALAHLDAGTRYDYAGNEEQRRELLIRLEVAAGVETPAEDKSRRMRYQLENLQTGMTSGALLDTRQRIAELSRQWYALGPVPGRLRNALQSRFLKATGR